MCRITFCLYVLQIPPPEHTHRHINTMCHLPFHFFYGIFWRIVFELNVIKYKISFRG